MIVSCNHFRSILQQYGINPDQNMAEYAARRILAKIDKVPNVLAKAIGQARPKIPRCSPHCGVDVASLAVKISKGALYTNLVPTLPSAALLRRRRSTGRSAGASRP